MPITPFINDEQFDPETTRVIGVALEMTCIALRTGDCDDGVREAIASKIIELAKAGERNPDYCVSKHWRPFAGSGNKGWMYEIE